MNTPAVRLARLDDLPAFLRLMNILQPDDPIVNPQAKEVQTHWAKCLATPDFHALVAEDDGMLVSSCVLVVVPNMTRGLRPYALIENVITAPSHRGKGHATRILKTALQKAWELKCYKVMLLTGRTDESVFRLYERAGFKRGIKTGFIAYP